MTQHEIDCAVAIATGEPISTITQKGFTIADPDIVGHDPEPCDVPPNILDWDVVQRIEEPRPYRPKRPALALS